MQFQRGQRHSPARRPRGARLKRMLLAERLLEADAEALVNKLIEAAMDGDAGALRLCIDRIASAHYGRPRSGGRKD